jgi:uncharacterized protein YbbK (DUF523 family)
VVRSGREKILVSACLLGAAVRYNGKDKKSDHPILQRWIDEERVVSACPEVLGGLGTPRPPAEIVQIAGLRRVQANDGRDVTREFDAGAAAALEQARRAGARVAVLKARSPSCGSGEVYDGTFTSTPVPGDGIATALLRSHGIRVFSENEFEAAAEYVATLEAERRT